jgi:hypothetical protein
LDTVSILVRVPSHETHGALMRRAMNWQRFPYWTSLSDGIAEQRMCLTAVEDARKMKRFLDNLRCL